MHPDWDRLAFKAWIPVCQNRDDVDLLEPQDNPPGSGPSRSSRGSGAGQQTTGVVALLQAVRLPGQHAKLVRAKVSEQQGCPLSYFEPSRDWCEEEVIMPEAAVKADEE